MTNSITPPPELIGRWEEDWHHSKVKHIELEDHIANEAAQWGADQELEACITWLDEMQLAGSGDIEVLRAARRPKPPSLKEQAIAQLREVNAMLQFQTTGGETSAIRAALEALDD
jgi:hypothetical protein